MKKEFFDFVWKVIDKFGYPVLGAFILSIVTLVIAPDKYVEMVPFPDNKIYWACAILVVLYTLIFALLRYVWSEFRKKKVSEHLPWKVVYSETWSLKPWLLYQTIR